MDHNCENKTRLVQMNGDLLTVTLIPCKKCETCKPKPTQITTIDLVESEDEIDY